MLLGTSNNCNTAATSKNAATDFSIAAIMSKNAQSREPSERSLSKYAAAKEHIFLCFGLVWFDLHRKINETHLPLSMDSIKLK